MASERLTDAELIALAAQVQSESLMMTAANVERQSQGLALAYVEHNWDFPAMKRLRQEIEDRGICS